MTARGQRFLPFLALVILGAGCATPPEDQQPNESPSASSDVCDRPLLTERIRAREVDLARQAENLAAAFIVSVPTTRASPPQDWPMWNALARSDDGGVTWRFATLGGYPGDARGPGALSQAQVLSDPVVLFLQDGTLLHAGLAVGASFDVYVQRYAPGGLDPETTAVVGRGTAAAGAHIVPTPFPAAYNDKPLLAEDPITRTVYLSWQWRYESGLAAHTAPVLSRSDDGGRTWSDPVYVTADGRIEDVDGPFYWNAWPVTTQDGLLHVFMLDYRDIDGRIVQVTSRDDGRTFEPGRTIIDGVRSIEGFSPERAMPSVAVHRPADATTTIYISWADTRNGDEDVFLVASRDGGVSWEEPLLVTAEEDDGGVSQFFPRIAVSPEGHVGVLYYESESENEGRFRARLATSADGQTGWTVRDLASLPSQAQDVTNDGGPSEPDPSGRTRTGDYNGLVGSAEGFDAAWQDGRQGRDDAPFSEIWICTGIE